ncbi:glycosyltransferase [Rubrobacter marinus]|uniref:glycosyltransferase n=1 Tax=Rubrobacter marinus TaxID=2653852 RepID=UPI001A9D6FB0|nr:glycosyltransferase [Rubrobacter marinus]
MRVLNVNMTLDLVHGGGTAERTFQISRNLARAGVDCDLLVLDLGLTVAQLKALDGVRVFALPSLNRRFYVPAVSPTKIRRVVKDADVVHLMGHWTLVNALVYLFARYMKKPYVVCPAGALPIYGRSRRLKRLYNAVIGRRIVRDADGHVAIVRGEIPQLEDYGVPAKGVCVIPNGIEPADYRSHGQPALRDEHGVGDAPYVLFVGRLNEIKGPDLLLEAFAAASGEFPEHHLVFAGPTRG